ncbi:hypothetical protein VTN02DRAFT_487 [Thermoascus thermophilus]
MEDSYELLARPLALAPAPSHGAICTRDRGRNKAPYFVTADDDLLVARPALWKRPWSAIAMPCVPASARKGRSCAGLAQRRGPISIAY